MTAIITVVILAWLATGLGMGYGWSRATIRANRAEQREGLRVIAADLRDKEIARLRTMLASAEADRDKAETEAATYLGLINDEVLARINAELDAKDLRAEMLPTVRGNYLDTVANLPVGFRLDWGSFGSETPIGASVVESLAAVVPIVRGAK